MSGAQNAFAFPSPAPSSPSPQRAHQARPSNKPSDKEAGSAKDDGDNAILSFMALLNQAADGVNEKSEPSPVLDLRLSAEHGQTLEDLDERAASLPLGGDKLLLSKSILDLMSSLKNDLEKKGVDVDSFVNVNDVLDELGPDWDSKAVEAMLSRLRDRYVTILESDGSRNIDIRVSVSDYLKFGLEASLTGSVEMDKDGPEEDQSEAAQLNGVPQMNLHALAGDGEQDEGLHEAYEKSLTLPEPWVSRLYSYLKPLVSKESAVATDTAAQGANQAEQQTDKNSSVDVKAMNVEVTPLENTEAKPENESSAGFREQRDNSGSGRDVPARSESREDAYSDKDSHEPKTKFIEHRTAFEQFFEHVTARRGAGDAPALELPMRSPFSQGEALRDGLDNVIRFIRVAGEQKANLTIDPPALGKVSVELTSSATGLEASIKVSSEQVRQLIQDHLAQLKLSLEQQGVQLTHFSVDVQQDNERGDQSQGNARRRNTGLGANEEDSSDEEAVFRVDLNQGILYWIA